MAMGGEGGLSLIFMLALLLLDFLKMLVRELAKG